MAPVLLWFRVGHRRAPRPSCQTSDPHTNPVVFTDTMRLEIEPTMDVVPMTGQTTSQKNLDHAEAKSALNEGIKSAQAGNR